jgi:hypothetical protein
VWQQFVQRQQCGKQRSGGDNVERGESGKLGCRVRGGERVHDQLPRLHGHRHRRH